jgi:hypothetical protein
MLDPSNPSLTVATLGKAAPALGRKVELRFAHDSLVGVFIVAFSLMPPMRCFIDLDELQITRVFWTGRDWLAIHKNSQHFVIIGSVCEKFPTL